jgi:predicted MPP superfamily phosphohydrolase
VLGNHDYEAGRENEVRRILEQAGIQVLEGQSTVIDTGTTRVGVAGPKGFGGASPAPAPPTLASRK